MVFEIPQFQTEEAREPSIEEEDAKEDEAFVPVRTITFDEQTDLSCPGVVNEMIFFSGHLELMRT